MIKIFFKEKIILPLRKQLRQGATPQGLALTVAVGVSLSIFPLLGTTMALCLLFGFLLKLNQPILHTVNYIMYPAQIILIPVFLKFGATLTGSDPISINPATIVHEFSDDIGLFFKNYGLAGLHAVYVWLLVAPLLTTFVYLILLPLFKRWRTS